MIELKQISKVFTGGRGSVQALRDVSLKVEKGEIYGIIGRSGAGKSTLIRCINLLERPTYGQVVVAGQDLTALPEADLRAARRNIGMIFQHFNLLSSRTVAGNVALPLELAGADKTAIKERVAALLELVDLADKATRYPAELSGGQKQRVGIARALASQPEILLCDEATSALDPETTKSILTLLKDINQKLNLTIVLITHEMTVIKEIADRVAVIEHGHLVEEGRVFDVFTNPRAETTRRFLSDVVNQELPVELCESLKLGWRKEGKPVVRVTFTGNAASDPVIYRAIRAFDVSFNILHGHVDYIQGRPFGTLTFLLEGPGQKIDEAINFITTQDLKVEVLGHVPNDHRAVA